MDNVGLLRATESQFARYMRDDIARWSRLAKERNIEIAE